MFNPLAIFGTQKPLLTREKAAELLKVHPDALAAFEAAYAAAALNHETDNFFDINSRQAAANAAPAQELSEEHAAALNALVERVVAELVA